MQECLSLKKSGKKAGNCSPLWGCFDLWCAGPLGLKTIVGDFSEITRLFQARQAGKAQPRGDNHRMVAM